MRYFWSQIKNFFSNLVIGAKRLRSFNRRDIPNTLESFSRNELFTLLALLVVLVLSGGFLFSQVVGNSEPGPDRGGEIVEGLVGQPQFINPVLSLTNNVDTDISRIVYAQLLKYDENQTLVPDLAESLPQISADQKTFTIKLRPNLKWQDGKPLTADDVLFTVQAIQNPEFESPLRPNLSRVKVEKIDDLTLTFTLREVSISFVNNFALGIIPKHIWEGSSARNFRLSEKNLNPVGSGPYVVNEIKKTADGMVKSMTLVPNGNYHDSKAYISKVTFKFFGSYEQLINAYQGREITTVGFVAFDNKAVLNASDKFNQYRLTLPQYQAIFFNLQKNSILTEKAVRQALWLTTNRDEIINNVYVGQAAPAFGPILPENIGYNPSIEQSVHYNIDEASQILEKSGWIIDPATGIRSKNGQALEFDFVVNGSLILNVKTAQLLQSQWMKAGIKANLILANREELEQNYIRPRAFEALLFSENIGADPDPFPFWHSTQVRDPGLNLSGFNNSEADRLLTEGRQTADQAVRAKDYQRFQEIINDQLPAIFLVRSLYIYNTPKKVQGITLTNIIQSSERFTNINKWYIED